jgi:hypothetical protein
MSKWVQKSSGTIIMATTVSNTDSRNDESGALTPQQVAHPRSLNQPVIAASHEARISYAMETALWAVEMETVMTATATAMEMETVAVIK